MKKQNIIEITALLFVVLFIYTGINKLLAYDIFKEQLSGSPVLKPIAGIVVWALPLVEFIVAIQLFIPQFRIKGLYSTLILMVGFTIYIIVILNFSSQIPCSCGGALEYLTWNQHLVFNGICIALCLWALHLARSLSSNRQISKTF